MAKKSRFLCHFNRAGAKNKSPMRFIFYRMVPGVPWGQGTCAIRSRSTCPLRTRLFSIYKSPNGTRRHSLASFCDIYPIGYMAPSRFDVPSPPAISARTVTGGLFLLFFNSNRADPPCQPALLQRDSCYSSTTTASPFFTNS